MKDDFQKLNKNRSKLKIIDLSMWSKFMLMLKGVINDWIPKPAIIRWREKCKPLLGMCHEPFD